MNRPNVLLILADQHQAKCMGLEGHPNVRTPHLDRLASEGIRFRNAIVQNPICTPSRVCWLSGQYCHNHGYYGLSGPRPPGLPNLLGHFRKAGYRTAAIGKIHCPEYWVEDNSDVFHDTNGASIGGRSPEYAKYLEERGLTRKEDHQTLWEFGPAGRQKVDGRPSMVAYEDSQEGWVAREAVRFMRNCREADRPFIMEVSFPKPHQTYAPAREFWDLYPFEDLVLPPNADWDLAGKPPNLRRMAEHWRKGEWTLFEPRTFEAGRLRKLRGYLGNISQVDRAVGDVLAGLREAGLDRDTIVIYSSDHGDFACEHGIMEKAPGIGSDAITRVPMIWRWPERFPAGAVCPELVETVDFAATVPVLCGLDPLETADGQDIAGLLAGGHGPVRKVAVTEFAWSKSVRKGPWRLVYYPPEMFAEEHPDGFGELYHIEDDPWEMRNLWSDPAHQDKVRELQTDLLDWLVTTTRPATVLRAQSWDSPQAVTRYRNTVNADGKLPTARVRERAGGNYL